MQIERAIDVLEHYLILALTGHGPGKITADMRTELHDAFVALKELNAITRKD